MENLKTVAKGESDENETEHDVEDAHKDCGRGGRNQQR